MVLKCSGLAMGIAGLIMAQHGGGHAGGGGGGSHASAPTGHFNSGYQTSITPPSYSGHLTLSTPTLTPSGLNRGGYRPVPVGPRPVGVRPPTRRPGGYGYGTGYYGLGLYPFLGYGYYGDSYGDQQPLPEQYAQPPYEAMPEQSGDYYPPVPYAMGPEQQQPQPPPVAEPPAPPSTPITIVLKSGQKMEVQNYAIMNGVFWDFTKQNSKRIPLAQVDVAASAKATDAAGGAFPEESFATNPN